MASEGRAGLLPIPRCARQHRQLRVFSRRACRLWRSVLVRRSQRAQVGWDRLNPCSTGGFRNPVFCTLIPTSALTPSILGKSRMRKRARTDLCGGRSAMVVPTATVGRNDGPAHPAQ